jgi:S-sulfo-L-cysteine synthase (O-acetyl-L-serine-dependent)
MGSSRFFKEKNPAIAIVGCQPMPGTNITGIRRWPPEYLPKIYEPARIDRIIDIDPADAESTTRALAREEGVFAGVSSGGAVWAARVVCRELAAAGKDGIVVCIICDRGDRYVSSTLFDTPAFAGGPES